VEIALKAAIDFLSHVMQTVGLTKMLVLDEKLKLRNGANSMIGVMLVCVYFIGLFIALASLCILLVVDVNKLGKDSMGLIKFDSLLAKVDFSQIEKDFGKHLTSSVELFEQQMNMTIPEDIKQKFN